MPTQLPPTLTIGAILQREDPRDAVIIKPSLPYTSLSSLPAGSIVGTSSVRRSAQIARLHPHLKFKDVRGNVDTRLRKLDDPEGDYACLLLAAAGLNRMNLGHRITQLLDSKNGGVLHAVGQGALGIEVREGDERTRKLVGAIAHRPTALACLAERSLMRTLEGGCSVPIGVETGWEEAGRLKMRAVVVSLDGTQSVEDVLVGEVEEESEADEFGWKMAGKLVEKGAEKILKDINLNRELVTA
jgi:hydroxymethylbilane synthase